MNGFRATVSIDLGASYTKVAYRPRLPHEGEHFGEAEAQVLVLDGSPLIPSLAIFTGRASQPWVFGREAAIIKPSEEMKVFINWKANFFRPGNDEISVEAVIVAGHFFAWLRERISDQEVDLEHCETRVAIPAFEGRETKAQMLAKCMELNGWKTAKILMSTEPHANAIGVFSSGRNVVVCASDNRKPLLCYGEMFGQNIYIQIARNMILYDANPMLSILMVDIGAFTTDLALLKFDTRSEDDGLHSIIQHSHALGVINQLDRKVFSALENRHGFDWSRNSFEDAEGQKRTLYAGGTVPVLMPGFSGEIGDAEDQTLVNQHAREFAGGIWAEMNGLLEQEKPKKVYLYGGWCPDRARGRSSEYNDQGCRISFRGVKTGSTGKDSWEVATLGPSWRRHGPTGHVRGRGERDHAAQRFEIRIPTATGGAAAPAGQGFHRVQLSWRQQRLRPVRRPGILQKGLRSGGNGTGDVRAEGWVHATDDVGEICDGGD